MPVKEKSKSASKIKPPLSHIKPSFKFPDYSRAEHNGIDLLMFQSKSQPLVNLKIVYPGGSAGEKIWGLSSVSSHLLTRGTKIRTARQIARESDSMGISLNSGSNWDYCQINANFISDYLDRTFAMFADCALEPVFDDEETERIKLKQIASIAQNQADPDYLSQFALNSAVYANHLYGHPRLGTERTINSIKGDDCKNRFEEIAVKPAIIAAGNFEQEDLLKLIDNHFGNRFKKIASAPNYDTAPPKSIVGVVIIEKPGAVQTCLSIGKLIPGKSHPDYPAIHLLNVILGGYFQSRLNILLRQIKGYTYGVHSYIGSKNLCSALAIETSLNESITAEAVSDIIIELGKLSLKKITKNELEQAKQYQMGSFLRSIETPMQISNLLASLQQFKLSADYYTDFFNKIANFTPEDLFRVQKDYYSPDGLTIAASGNVEFLKEQLAQFGKIYICDTEGNLSET